MVVPSQAISMLQPHRTEDTTDITTLPTIGGRTVEDLAKAKVSKCTAILPVPVDFARLSSKVHEAARSRGLLVCLS